MNTCPTPPMFDPAPPLACTRWLGNRNCGLPAKWHVIWTPDCENGLTCDEHMDEARRRWAFMGAHEYRMECSMPGAVYVWAENICVVDEDGLGLSTTAAVEAPV